MDHSLELEIILVKHNFLVMMVLVLEVKGINQAFLSSRKAEWQGEKQSG